MDNKYLSILLLIVFLVNLIPPVTVHAKTINVDGDPSDWTGTPPTDPNSSRYDVEAKEWIWRDASGDERTDFANPDPQVDLLEFRVTGDSNFLYMLFKFNFPANLYIGDNGATFIAIAIDRDRTPNSGVEWFAGESDTRVHGNARWEYQVVINLADSRFTGQELRNVSSGLVDNWGGIFYIVNTAWNHLMDTDSLLSVNLDNNTIEVKVKWSTIGGTPNNVYVRFSLITARGWSNFGGNGGGAWDIGGNAESDALDAVTTTGPNTWDEVSDGVVDYYVDVYFVNGEATPPPPPTYRLFGYVRDQYNNPVKDATVVVDGSQTSTDDNGYYEVVVGAGTYTITVTKPNYAKYKATVVVTADTQHDVTLWRFKYDLTSNANDFPAAAKVYEAPALLTATGNDENALKFLYVDRDDEFIYVATDFYAGTWGLAYGIGIDANPGTTAGYGVGASDSWGRKIGFKHAYVDYQVYFWVDGGTVHVGQLNKYDDGSWSYGVADVYYSPLASGHDGNTLFKVAIPLDVIAATEDYNGEVLLAVWIAGGDGSSAVSALPLNPDVLTAGAGEWTDTDVIYSYVKFNVQTGVAEAYPLIDSTLATDKDTYEVYINLPVTVRVTLTDAETKPLMFQRVYIAELAGVEATTNMEGKASLTFTPTTEGTFTYTVRFDGHWGWSSSSKTITVIVTVPPVTYTISGTVVDHYTGAPIVGATVELLDMDRNVVKSTTTGAGGVYELKDIVPGTYVLRITATGYVKWYRKVIVDSDKTVDARLVRPAVDITRNANDFPPGSLIYKASAPLTNFPGARHAVSELWLAWDTEYLYVGVDLMPAEWWVALSVGIDVNPGVAHGFGAVYASDKAGWRDAWTRRINYTTPYAVGPVYPELLAYFSVQGRDGITTGQVIRYEYETYGTVVPPPGVNHWEPWDYGYATPLYSPVADAPGRLTKVAIPLEALLFLPGVEFTGEVALIVSVSHGYDTSAMSALPLNPLAHDKAGRWDDKGEFADTDSLYMSVRLTYDVDKDFTPELVRADTRAVFYPTISTVVETDKDLYEVGAGGDLTIKARVKDALGNYLPFVKVELYDHANKKLAEAYTRTNDTTVNSFYADLTAVAKYTAGDYTWRVRFVGEAGFTVSEKTVTVRVGRAATRFTGLMVLLIDDKDRNGRISSGDLIEFRARLEGYDPVGDRFIGLEGKGVTVKFNYTLNRVVDTVSATSGTGGWVVVRHTVRTITGADTLGITVEFAGDADYFPSSASTSVDVNLARVIDGFRDWGTKLPRSTPGIAPRDDEIVITDPTNDIHKGATGKYAELDISEVRVTWDGLYLYFYVKFAGALSDDKHFTVNIAIDVTPDNPVDGVDMWLFGYWMTDTRLGGFDATGAHVDVWKWTHVIEAIPIEGQVRVFNAEGAPTPMGVLAVNKAEGFIEFAVPATQLKGFDATEPFRVWIVTFGVPSKGFYVSLTGVNFIDIAGVGDTNLEALTHRDPDWGNLVWPKEDVWIDTAFTLKFTAPGKPGIPDPSPDVPPTLVKILGVIYNESFTPIEEFRYVGDRAFYGAIVVKVEGTQGRPVVITIGENQFIGVVNGDGIAIVPAYGPGMYSGYLTITATSDGASDSASIYYTLTWLTPPPAPEPAILPLLILTVALIILFIRRRSY